MRRSVVVGALTLLLFLVPNPVVPDEILAADSAQVSATDEEKLEEYVPSQQVSADASISFPVDI